MVTLVTSGVPANLSRAMVRISRNAGSSRCVISTRSRPVQPTVQVRISSWSVLKLHKNNGKDQHHIVGGIAERGEEGR